MNGYKICPLTPAHCAAAAELEKSCFPEPWSEASLRMLTGEMGVGCVALDETDRVVAYGGMFLAPDEGQITNIAVEASHRRQGLGKELLLGLRREAEKRNLAQISLEVRVSNLPAVELYRSQGFRVAGTRKGFYRHPKEDAYVMLLNLNISDRK